METVLKWKEDVLNGKKLPEEWRMMIENYIHMKEKSVNKRKDEYLRVYDDLKEAYEIKDLLMAYGTAGKI